MLVRRSDSGGAVVYEGTLSSGTSVRLAVSQPLWMRVGWTPRLQVTLGGQPVALSGGTADFIVTRASVTRLKLTNRRQRRHRCAGRDLPRPGCACRHRARADQGVDAPAQRGDHADPVRGLRAPCSSVTRSAASARSAPVPEIVGQIGPRVTAPPIPITTRTVQLSGPRVTPAPALLGAVRARMAWAAQRAMEPGTTISHKPANDGLGNTWATET